MEIPGSDFRLPNGGRILDRERDSNLFLHSETWTSNLGPDWKRAGHSAERQLDPGYVETIIRWPSAPVYGIHRRDDYLQRLKRINYHTLRVVRKGAFGSEVVPAKRIYILHNGLNELEHLTLYYKLAGILTDEESACIIRPFPGHLTRFPLLPRFAEKPLDRYLADAGDLFRQYLRFMLETQWLISALVPLRSYRAVAGLDLLAEGTETKPARERPAHLAGAIFEAWHQLFLSSERSGRKAGRKVTVDAIEGAIRELREVLGWQPWAGKRTGDQLTAVNLDSPPDPEALRPSLHAIGYSLGGYAAQSVFFSWPFAVSSCTTICSGGALSDLTLTKFANPEEWQTVMRAMKYEIESAMLDGRLQQSAGLSSSVARPSSHAAFNVAGLPEDFFRYFYRIFNEVFVQEHPGSYSSRVSEYQSRLLFVAGGRDPIVSVPRILEAGPEEGINLIEVADLPHLISLPPEWKLFSQPHVVEGIKLFSAQAEGFASQAVSRYWWKKDRADIAGPKLERQQIRRQVSNLQDDLDALVSAPRSSGTRNEGWLFIIRNQLPAVLLGPSFLQRDSAALYHSDDNIAAYVRLLNDRRAALASTIDCTTIVIPTGLKKRFVERPPAVSESIETAGGGKLPTTSQLKRLWGYFETTWRDSILVFDPKTGIASNPLVKRYRTGIAPAMPIVNSLPDVWISLSRKGLELLRKATSERDAKKCLIRLGEKLSAEEDETKAARRANPHTTPRTPELDRLTMLLRLEDINIVKISAAEFNPRFIGQRVRESDDAAKLIIHSAIALAHSTPLRRTRQPSLRDRRA